MAGASYKAPSLSSGSTLPIPRIIQHYYIHTYAPNEPRIKDSSRFLPPSPAGLHDVFWYNYPSVQLTRVFRCRESPSFSFFFCFAYICTARARPRKSMAREFFIRRVVSSMNGKRGREREACSNARNKYKWRGVKANLRLGSASLIMDGDGVAREEEMRAMAVRSFFFFFAATVPVCHCRNSIKLLRRARFFCVWERE